MLKFRCIKVEDCGFLISLFQAPRYSGPRGLRKPEHENNKTGGNFLFSLPPSPAPPFRVGSQAGEDAKVKGGVQLFNDTLAETRTFYLKESPVNSASLDQCTDKESYASEKQVVKKISLERGHLRKSGREAGNEDGKPFLIVVCQA